MIHCTFCNFSPLNSINTRPEKRERKTYNSRDSCSQINIHHDVLSKEETKASLTRSNCIY